MAASGDAVPIELDSFVGREFELAEARRLFQNHRLVTLTGPAGVGKTRLSKHLIARERPAFPGGVFVANLTDITATDLVPTVSSALGIPDTGPAGLDGVLDFVGHHQNVLLVLDNCEELVHDVRGVVSAVLHAAPGIRILATSRIMLGAPGERPLKVPPLPADDALRLLVDRGAAVRPQWEYALRDHGALPADEMAAARQVCELLDGLPLAIEMVASWLDVRTIQETVHHLADRMRFLVAPDADQPNHRSMSAALNGSYGLLSPTAQRMLAAAAVFAGPFDLTAAQAVAAALPMDHHDVLTALTSLVRHSLLGSDTRDGRTWYTMLATIRDYSSQTIPEQAEPPQLRAAHAEYYFDLVVAAEADWFSPREVDWMHTLGEQVPDIRLALDHFHRGGRSDRALRLSVLAARTRFDIDEARQWLRAGLAAYNSVDELRVEALALAAWLSLLQGESQEPLPLLAQCREAAAAAGCVDTSGPLVLAEATRLWLTEPNRDRAGAAIALFAQAAELFHQAGQPGGHYTATWFGAAAACYLGDAATASRLTQDLVTQAEQADAPRCIAWSAWTRALLDLLHDGNLHAAMGWTQHALDMARTMGDTVLPAWGVWLAGCIAAHLGMAEQAAFLLGGARARQRGVRVRVDSMLPWSQVQQQAQTIARSTLGEDAFADHFARGESASYEDVMDAAPQELPRPPTDPHSPQFPPEWLPGLTPREHEVAGYVTQGWTNQEIAVQLVISARTVETHVARLIRKLRAGNRVGVAVRYAALQQRNAPRKTPPAASGQQGSPGDQTEPSSSAGRA